jgi:serine/threonine protein phosphatase PrpC
MLLSKQDEIKKDVLSLYDQPTEQKPSITLTSTGSSDQGRVRERNEDSFLCLPRQNLWVVADGMGGHDAGDFASQTITRQAAKFTSQATLDSSILLLEENIIHSNELIREKSSKMGEQATVGSTVAALYVWDHLALVLWAGDSRVYLLRNGQLYRLTEDHSYVEELVKMGKLTEGEAEHHPAANVVLNAVGIQAELTVDMDYYEIMQDDLFILCSDGLFKDLPESRIAEVIEASESSLDDQCRLLIDAALDAGGSDNCTVILVKAQADSENV